jgi:hypothetical protein
MCIIIIELTNMKGINFMLFEKINLEKLTRQELVYFNSSIIGL